MCSAIAFGFIGFVIWSIWVNKSNDNEAEDAIRRTGADLPDPPPPGSKKNQ